MDPDRTVSGTSTGPDLKIPLPFVKAIYSLYGQSLDLSHLATLQLPTPSSKLFAFERRVPKRFPNSRSNFWSYSTEGPFDNLEAPVSQLLDLLEGQASKLNAAAKTYSSEAHFLLQVSIHGDHILYSLSTSTIKRLSEFDAGLSIDIADYSRTDEE